MKYSGAMHPSFLIDGMTRRILKLSKFKFDFNIKPYLIISVFSQGTHFKHPGLSLPKWVPPLVKWLILSNNLCRTALFGPTSVRTATLVIVRQGGNCSLKFRLEQKKTCFFQDKSLFLDSHPKAPAPNCAKFPGKLWRSCCGRCSPYVRFSAQLFSPVISMIVSKSFLCFFN